MLVLITDDVNTADAKGSKRLRKVAKICVNYGQRMQNSVFECLLSPAELCVVKNQLFSIIDESKDSLCIYNLGNINSQEHSRCVFMKLETQIIVRIIGIKNFL